MRKKYQIHLFVFALFFTAVASIGSPVLPAWGDDGTPTARCGSRGSDDNGDQPRCGPNDGQPQPGIPDGPTILPVDPPAPVGSNDNNDNYVRKAPAWVSALATLGTAPICLPMELADLAWDGLSSVGAVLAWGAAKGIIDIPANLGWNFWVSLKYAGVGTWRGLSYLFHPEHPEINMDDVTAEFGLMNLTGNFKDYWSHIARWNVNEFNTWMTQHFYDFLGKSTPHAEIPDSRVGFLKLLVCERVSEADLLFFSLIQDEGSGPFACKDAEGTYYDVYGAGLGAGIFALQDGNSAMMILDFNPLGSVAGFYGSAHLGAGFSVAGSTAVAVGELGFKWIVSFSSASRGSGGIGVGALLIEISEIEPERLTNNLKDRLNSRLKTIKPAS